MSEIKETHTVTANTLVKKRADILFEIKDYEKQISQLKADLLHLDATLRLFRPDFVAEGLPVRHRRPTKSPYFEHGEMTERIYDALRDNDAAASGDIAAQAMRDKGLDPENDRATRRDFVRRVTLQIQDLVRKGQVEKIGGRGPTTRWRLKPPG